MHLCNVAVKRRSNQPDCGRVTHLRLTGYDCDSVSCNPDTSPPDLDGRIAIYNLLETQFPRVIVVVFLMGCVGVRGGGGAEGEVGSASGNMT